MGPLGPVVLDATPLDSGHRTRGLGRYVQGLLEGFAALERKGELPVELILLRSSQGEASADQLPFETIIYPRLIQSSAAWMSLENHLRLDRVLPPRTALYHGTAMEGISRRFPWLATCHDLIPLLLKGGYLRPWNLPNQLFWRTYARNLRSRADFIVAISHHVKQTLVQNFGCEAGKVEVVHHGLSSFWSRESTASPSSPEVAQLASFPFVLFVGGFDQRKNFDTAVMALDLIPRAIRPKLVVAGVRSPLIKWKHRLLLSRASIEVCFLEYVTDQDLLWLYRRCCCLLFPSREEGWGFPIVEAMAAGAPVICADQGSMKESAGGAAVTVDVASVEECARAVRRLLTNEALREERIAAGKERSAALTWENSARETAQVYRRLLQRRALRVR